MRGEQGLCSVQHAGFLWRACSFVAERPIQGTHVRHCCTKMHVPQQQCSAHREVCLECVTTADFLAAPVPIDSVPPRALKSTFARLLVGQQVALTGTPRTGMIGLSWLTVVMTSSCVGPELLPALELPPVSLPPVPAVPLPAGATHSQDQPLPKRSSPAVLNWACMHTVRYGCRYQSQERPGPLMRADGCHIDARTMWPPFPRCVGRHELPCESIHITVCSKKTCDLVRNVPQRRASASGHGDPKPSQPD